MRLRRVEKLIDIEIERVEQTDDLNPALPWQFIHKAWISGVHDARAVSARRLWHLKDACYEDEPQ
jgi:hypothetical protein